ncbi:MAG TPA: hypothetical protein V6C97_33335 [Oculatellaceae cyanobacterium]
MNYKFLASENLTDWYIWSVITLALLERRQGVCNQKRLPLLRSLLENTQPSFKKKSQDGGDGQAVLIDFLKLCPRKITRYLHKRLAHCAGLAHTCDACGCHKPKDWQRVHHIRIPRSSLDNVEAYLTEVFSPQGAKSLNEIVKRDEGGDSKVIIDVESKESSMLCGCAPRPSLRYKIKQRAKCLPIFTYAYVDFIKDDAVPELHREVPGSVKFNGEQYDRVIALFHPAGHYYSLMTDPQDRRAYYKCDPFGLGENPSAQRLSPKTAAKQFAPSKTSTQPAESRDLLFILYVAKSCLDKPERFPLDMLDLTDWDPVSSRSYRDSAFRIWNECHPKDIVDTSKISGAN